MELFEKNFELKNMKKENVFNNLSQMAAFTGDKCVVFLKQGYFIIDMLRKKVVRAKLSGSWEGKMSLLLSLEPFLKFGVEEPEFIYWSKGTLEFRLGPNLGLRI